MPRLPLLRLQGARDSGPLRRPVSTGASRHRMTVETRPLPVTDTKSRCWRCRRVLAVEVTRPERTWCSRCKAENGSGPGE